MVRLSRTGVHTISHSIWFPDIILELDTCLFFTCAKCEAKSCYSCRLPAHPTYTCAQHAAIRHKGESSADVKTRKYIAKRTMKCFSCGVHVQKTGGCDHITCKVCKSNWCWRCGADYKVIRVVGNSAHARNCRHYRDPQGSLHRKSCIIS